MQAVIKNRIKYIICCALLALNLSACSTIHTGPLLIGDIPLPFGRMAKGEVYTDKKGRFEVPCPESDSVVSKGKYGVSFIYMDGISNYNVYAYDSQGVSEYQFTIEATLQGIKNMLVTKKIDFTVELEQYEDYRGYQALDFDFKIPSRGNQASRVYVTKLVKTKNYIYWINYSNAMLFDKEIKIEKRHFDDAYAFFDTVKFDDQLKGK